jgi:hypothetical protein
MAGAICDLAEKLCGRDGERWFTELKRFLRKKMRLDVVVERFSN